MFNEQEWIRLLFLLSDTQSWLDDMCSDAIAQLPISEKKRFLRKNYYLTVPVVAHILERHYHKIGRHPQVGKFTIPVIEILDYIRDGFSLPINPVPGYPNFQRIKDAGKPIGYDKNGTITTIMTILTDGGGKIIIAFPGLLISSEDQYSVNSSQLTADSEQPGINNHASPINSNNH